MHRSAHPLSPKVIALLILAPVLLIILALPGRFIVRGQGGGVIRACTRQVGLRKEITIMVLADSCEPGWTPLEWNQQGAPGPEGPPGPAGETGAQGPQGPAGTTGINVYRFDDLQSSGGQVLTEKLRPADGKNFCSLEKVAIWANGDPAEISFCEVYSSSDGYWYLKADSKGDSHADCRAMCIGWP